jgi:hypothetical protein
MSLQRVEPGKPLGKFPGGTWNQLVQIAERSDAAARFRVDRKGRGGAGGESLGTGAGIIWRGDQAVWNNDSRTMEIGKIFAWPFTTPPAWSPTSRYAIHDMITLSAAAWSPQGTYANGALVERSGSVYQCTTATGPDEEFPTGDFTRRGALGQWFVATASSSGTVASPATFVASQWASTDATLWIDRYTPTLVANFSASQNYTAGAAVKLNGGVWESSASYTVGQLVNYRETIYQCTTATGPDAEFPAGDFASRGASNSLWKAVVNVTASPWDSSEWRPLTKVVELDHGLSYKDVTEGSYVYWIGKEAVVMHCEAVENWS